MAREGQRRRSWVSIDKAIELVEEPGVAPLLRRLAEFEASLVGAREHV